MVPYLDSVLVPTGDRTAYYWHRRDRRGFAAALGESIGLHARLWLRWGRLGREYRRAAPALVSARTWLQHFGERPS